MNPRAVAGLLALLLSLGCRNLLDLDAYDFGGGAGGAGGSGGGPAPCDAGLVPGACGQGQKCGLLTLEEGLEGGAVCTDAGAKPAWNLCASDAECEDTTFCEPATGVCKPWCVDGDDTCPVGAACVQARSADGTALPGLSVCTAHCDLDAPEERCGAGVSCVLVSVPSSGDEPDEGDCVATAGKGAGCSCNAATDCDPGLRCDLTAGECRAWCKVGATCPGGPACSGEIIEYDGEELGQCPPPAGMCIE